MPSNVLPKAILPQSTSIGNTTPDGRVIIDINWWLFLLNLSNQVLGPSGSSASGQLPISAVDTVQYGDIESYNSDSLIAQRMIANTALMWQEQDDQSQLIRSLTNSALQLSDTDPSPRDIVNALIAGLDNLLPDASPQAQPIVSVTVGSSPFSYTSPANGALLVSGGTISSSSLSRPSGGTFSSTALPTIPVSRKDVVTITYTVAPTITFIPT